MRTLQLRTLARALFAELESFSFPDREDAIYLNVGTVRTDEATALIPPALVHHLIRSRPRLERAGLSLSPTHWVAVDPVSGRLMPVPTSLEIPPDALDRLEERGGTDGRGDWSFVDGILPVAAVCWLGELEDPPLVPMTRGVTLHHIAGQAANLPKLGGRALEGLGRLVGGARCYGLGGDSSREAIDALDRVLRQPAR